MSTKEPEALTFFSWACNISENPWRFIPNVLAKASCCIIFNLLNSSIPPTWSTNNLAASAVLPWRANSLAFSKFNCLPVRSSASISAAIESSKFNKDEAMSSSWSISRPNFLAATTDFINASGCLANLICIVAEVLDTSVKSCFWLIASLFTLIEFKATLAILVTILPASCAESLANVWNLARASAENPAKVFNLINVFKVLSESFSVEPKAE